MNTNDPNQHDRDDDSATPEQTNTTGPTAASAAVEAPTSLRSRIARRVNPFGTSKLR